MVACAHGNPDVQGLLPCPARPSSLFTFPPMSIHNTSMGLGDCVALRPLPGTASFALCAVKGGFQLKERVGWWCNGSMRARKARGLVPGQGSIPWPVLNFFSVYFSSNVNLPKSEKSKLRQLLKSRFILVLSCAHLAERRCLAQQWHLAERRCLAQQRHLAEPQCLLE